jgi:UDP-GlcNAc:undecaprenyl-phosphate/decaprenyl-phosphate GlcNAc-1-phosphate transferase
MTVIIAAIVGFLAGRMFWIALRQSWHRPPFMRTNYRDVSIPTAAGVVVAFALVLVEAVRAVMGAAGVQDPPGLDGPRVATIIAVLGFAALGLLDDLTGTTNVRGIIGHLKALGRGELTSGALKMFMGIATALVAAAALAPEHLGTLVVDAAIICLAANFFNLLDVRPGRAGKVSVVVFVLLALGAAFDTALVSAAVAVGAGVALMLDDVRERLMLGDAGSNAIGAAIGAGLVTQLEGSGAVAVLIAFAVLNVLSEFTSFSTIIERVAPLRAFDMIGRRAHQQPAIDVRDSAPSGRSPFSSGGSSRPRPSGIRATVGGAHDEGPIDLEPYVAGAAGRERFTDLAGPSHFDSASHFDNTSDLGNFSGLDDEPRSPDEGPARGSVRNFPSRDEPSQPPLDLFDAGRGDRSGHSDRSDRQDRFSGRPVERDNAPEPDAGDRFDDWTSEWPNGDDDFPRH